MSAYFHLAANALFSNQVAAACNLCCSVPETLLLPLWLRYWPGGPWRFFFTAGPVPEKYFSYHATISASGWVIIARHGSAGAFELIQKK